ncbi:hypothetical protein [Halobacillus andaensis]
MEIHRKTGLSRNTVYKIKFELNGEAGEEEFYGNKTITRNT